MLICPVPLGFLEILIYGQQNGAGADHIMVGYAAVRKDEPCAATETSVRPVDANKLVWLVILVWGMGLLYPNGSSGGLSIASSWKARALEATEKLIALDRKLDQLGREGSDAALLKCQVMVETAYVMHSIGEEPTHKKDGGKEYFHFALNGGNDGLFDLVYFYSQQGELLGIRVDLLPKGWSIIHPPKSQRMMILRSSEGRCLFGFDLQDPFAVRAIEP